MTRQGRWEVLLFTLVLQTFPFPGNLLAQPSSAPLILREPNDLTVNDRGWAWLEVLVEGTPPLRFEWYRDGEVMAGETNALLVVTNSSAMVSGNYSVEVSNDYGEVLSREARLEVRPPRRFGIPRQWDLITTNDPPPLHDVIAVSSGRAHTLALRRDGTVVAWGDNDFGQTEVPSGLSEVVEVAAGQVHSLALRADGTVVGWGRDFFGQSSPPEGLDRVIGIAAGGEQSLVLRSDGSVVAWGQFWDAAGEAVVGMENVRQISTGSDVCLGLRKNGGVVMLSGDAPESVPVEGLEGVIAIASGGLLHLALREEGTVFAWGFDLDGQTQVPPDLTNAVAVASNHRRGLALTATGELVQWGFVGNTPMGLTNLVAVAAEEDGRTVVIEETGVLIVGEPADLTVEAGQPAVLSIDVTGEGPLRYQWFVNGHPISNETNQTLTLDVAHPGDGGLYRVEVSGSLGTVASREAVLTVLSAPYFVIEPKDVAVDSGEPASIEASVSGTLPISLAWYRGDVALSGWNQTVLRFDSARLEDQGGYWLVASNSYGSVTSRVAQLTVRTPPEILDHPQGGAWFIGQEVRMALQAVGSDPLEYQWYIDGQPLAGATADEFTIVTASLDDEGVYQVIVMNEFGAVSSEEAVVYVRPRSPTFFEQPADREVVAGAAVSFSAVAFGEEELTYQWFRDGAAISGANEPVFHLAEAWRRDEGEYRVEVLNGAGSALSDPAILTVRSPPNVVQWGRTDQGFAEVPGSLTNAISISGSGSHILALAADGRVVAWGGTNGFGERDIPSDLGEVKAIAAGDGFSAVLMADGSVRAWGDNRFGQAEPPGGLDDAVAITAGSVHALALREDGSVAGWGSAQHGQSTVPGELGNAVSIAAGLDHSVAATADGRLVGWGLPYGEPLGVTNAVEVSGMADRFMARLADGRSLVWTRNNNGDTNWIGPAASTAISAGWMHSLFLMADGKVAAAGSISSGALNVPPDLPAAAQLVAGYSYSLALIGVPAFISHPQSQTVVEGESVVLDAEVNSSTPVEWQWLRNGSPLPGATDRVLTLTGVRIEQRGTYQVVGSNSAGSTTSRPAELQVQTLAPFVLADPTDQTVDAGGTVTFEAGITGEPPMEWQWLFNGNPIPGGTNAVLSIAGAQLEMAGLYAVRASNAHGEVTTEPATLTFGLPDLIVDNREAEVMGLWILVTGGGGYGPDYLLKGGGDGNEGVRFRPFIEVPSTYLVSVFTPPHFDLTTVAPVHVHHAQGQDLIRINQRFQSGWGDIGAFPFAAGEEGYVEIRDDLLQTSGSVAADAVRLRYLPAPPWILSQPQDTRAEPGGGASFQVEVMGREPVAYQWQFEGGNIPGAHGSVLMLAEIGPDVAGGYRVLVTDPGGAVFSRTALLEVGPFLSVTIDEEGPRLEWMGSYRLQSAPNVTGPYADVVPAVSPYPIVLEGERQRFYRLAE